MAAQVPQTGWAGTGRGRVLGHGGTLGFPGMFGSSPAGTEELRSLRSSCLWLAEGSQGPCEGQFLGSGGSVGTPPYQGSLPPGGAGNVPSAQSEVSLPCQALTQHIPQKMERKKLPVLNNWILSAKRLGRRVLGFYLLSSSLKPC